MQLALYRAERPETFDEIIGQKHIVRILQNQLRTDTVSQAYLFAGTHGTGKTSTARILAKALNCIGEDEKLPCGHCENCEEIREGRFVDCIELDAASNNGVDDLRAIVDMVKYPPSTGRYKVYIIDEVHMLSPAAENAFLKTLEEPPEHAVFILATTDPQKVRATIRSRCMELNFRRVTEEELITGMRRICARRGLETREDALATIAARADGSVRDALSILEQCIAAGEPVLDRAAVLEYTGAAGEDFFLALTAAVLAGDAGKVLVYIDEILKRGKDPRQILKDWLKHLRDLMVAKYVKNPENIVGMSEENVQRISSQAEKASTRFIESAIKLVSEYINMARHSERPRILLETAAVKLASENGAGRILAGEATTAVAAKAMAAEAAGTSFKIEGEARRETELNKEDEPRAETVLNPEPAVYPEIIATDLSPEEMWDAIVQEVAADDRSFISLVGNSSEALDFDSGELKISVRPGKIRFAEEKIRDIIEAARRLYGQSIIVSLKTADPGDEVRKTREMTEIETAQILQSDKAMKEAAQDIEDLFGIKPIIEG
ncbi:MAG: DNA polymerase III subunit gamma/tau [Mogibacterium sp.]|nr:DNA polymerase III subunit gamma/tau [Mogibacterium sp.]